MSNQSDAYDLGMHHIPYNQSAFFSHQHQPGPADPSMQRFHPLQSTHQHPMLVLNEPGSHQDPLGRFQGLDISNRGGPHLVKSEGPSISASESSSTLWVESARPYSLDLFIHWHLVSHFFKIWFNFYLIGELGSLRFSVALTGLVTFIVVVVIVVVVGFSSFSFLFNPMGITDILMILFIYFILFVVGKCNITHITLTFWVIFSNFYKIMLSITLSSWF